MKILTDEEDDILKKYSKSAKDKLRSYVPPRVEGVMTAMPRGQIFFESFHLPMVMKEIQKIKNDPSRVKAFFATLRAKARLEKEIAIIHMLEEYAKALASGVASQADVLRRQAELFEAERELIIAQDNLANVDLALQIKREEEKLAIAKLQKERRDLEKDQHPENEEEAFKREYAKKMRLLELRDQAERERFLYRYKKRLITERLLGEAQKQAENDILRDPTLTTEQKERLIENSRDLYERMCLEIA